MPRPSFLFILTVLVLPWILLACGLEPPARARGSQIVATQGRARAISAPLSRGVVEVGPAELIRPPRGVSTAK